MNDVNMNMKSATSETWKYMHKDFSKPSNGKAEATIPIPEPSQQAQGIFEEHLPSSVRATASHGALHYPQTDVFEWGHMSSVRPVSREQESHNMPPYDGTDVLGRLANAPTEQGIGISEEHPGEVRRVDHPVDQGATSRFSYMDGLGSDGTVDQFWQTGAKDHIRMWADQFLEEGDEYYYSMNSFKTNQFDPEFQLMGGLMNPTVGASPLHSCGRQQDNTADVQKELYSFTGDYNNNAFEDCQCQDAFLQHVYEEFRDETEPSVEFEQPMEGMVVPYGGYHQSFTSSWEKSLEDQKIEYKMLSEPVVVFVTDANGKSVPMAISMILFKSIQGIPCSRIMKVLFDSGESASMISSKVLPIGVQVDHDHKTNLVATLAGVMQPTDKVGVSGIRLPEFDRSLVIDKHNFLIFNAECKYDMILGSDFLAAYGMNLNYENLEVEWFRNVLPMNTTSFTKPQQSVFLDVHIGN